MTPYDDRVVQAIASYMQRHGYPPTFRDIGDACHLSSTQVARVIGWLVEDGRVTRDAGRARSVRVVEQEGER